MTQALVTRTCAYAPCSKEFEPDHWRQKFCTPTCRANQHYVDNPEKGRALVDGALRCVADDALDLVRGDAEESAEKARWTLIVREQIARTLMATGYFSVNDLEPLGIPAEHVNVCTSQIGSFASSKYMAKLTWHKSEKVSRKGGPYWTFQITERGREKLAALLEDIRSQLAGLNAENPEGTASDKDSLAPSTGRGLSMGIPRGAGSALSVQSGEDSGPLPKRKSDPATPPATGAAGSSPDHQPGLSPTSAYSGENPYA